MKLITVNKLIQKLKSFVNTAVDNGWMNANPFLGHKFKHDRLNIIDLTIAVLKQLENLEFAQPRLARVGGISMFIVYTGQHYLDAICITRDNITEGMDGNLWIHCKRKKTGKWIDISMKEILLSTVKRTIRNN